jgi:hypothetical protein
MSGPRRPRESETALRTYYYTHRPVGARATERPSSVADIIAGSAKHECFSNALSCPILQEADRHFERESTAMAERTKDVYNH